MQAEAADFTLVQQGFADYIRTPRREALPEGVEARRMQVYADLFYNNVQNLLASTFPVLYKMLGNDAWHALARDYFARHRAHTPLFPQMPKEFLMYLQEERGEHPEDPPFMRELAHYEWVELALSIDPREIPAPTHAMEEETLLNEMPRLSPLAWPLAYRFPVHRLSPEYRPDQAPEQPTYLVVYRNRRDEVGFMALNPVSARLLELIKEGSLQSGEEILRKITEELQHPDYPTVKRGGLQIMQDLMQREILI